MPRFTSVWFLILGLLIIFCRSVGFSQENQSVESILRELNINKSDCAIDLIKSKRLSTSESVVLIPEVLYSNPGESVYTLHLIITEISTGKITHRFSTKLFSDALRIQDIDFLYQQLAILNESETIGIVIKYEGSSRVDPAIIHELTLLVINENEFLPVLTDYLIYTWNGETDGTGRNGVYVEHSRHLSSISIEGSEYYGLEVLDKMTRTIRNNLQDSVAEQTEKIEILRYKNGAYTGGE